MIARSLSPRNPMHAIVTLCLSVLLLGAGSPVHTDAQTTDAVTELTQARRVFVPLEDLDVIIERDKQGVILPRAKFDVLLTQAKANAEKNSVPSGIPFVVTSADYAARIVGDQLLITVTAEITQFDDDWRELRFPLQRLGLEQALLDDAPAAIGRHPDGSVSLFSDTRGKHVLKLQLSTELTAQGSDQVAAFSLLHAPSGVLTLTLPAGKRLLIGNIQLERPAPLDQVADYRIAVGGSGGIQLRITDRAAENAADSLTFATTGYGLHVAPGEVTWHALTTLQVFGKAIDRLTFSVPSQLEIADVDASGLESWELTDDPNEPQRTTISLTFGQAFEGARKISFKGVMAVETGKTWSVPPLRIASVTSHIGQVVVQYPAGVRLRVEEAAGVRRATHEQQPSADMPDDLSKLNPSEYLRFDVWQADFTLRLTTQPKDREVQAAVAAVLDVNSTGLELQAALTIETHFAPLFDLDIRLAADWQVISALKDNQPLKWQLVGSEEPGVNRVRILLNPPLAADTNGEIRLSLRRDVEGWPVEANPITVDLPELFLPQSNLTEGALVVRGDDDLDLESLDLSGLDPQPLKADFERLRFQSQDIRYKGKLKIIRKPSRVAAQTVTIGRVDPQTFHTFLQVMVEVQGGGVRSIKVGLPESVGTAIRFECGAPRIVEQKSAAPQNGERIWTLQFDQRLRGTALITCDLELPRGESKEFSLPQCRIVNAERQNGYFAIEAGGEQRLTIVAKDADGTPLNEVDPLDLPTVYYQPKERIVAVYRAAAPGTTLALSEQKFEKLPIPTAICPLLEVSSILGRTGELQHRAKFQLNVVGVQGLHVTFPAGTTLWATLVDGRPVEVRRSGDVYLVPLANAVNAMWGTGIPRTLQLFYRSEVGAVSQFGKLTQEPPTLTVESGQRTALPVEVLEQKWDFHYPEETRLIGSHSPLEPDQPLDRTSILGNWNSRLRVPSMEDLGWQLFAVAVIAGIVALIGHAYRTHRALLAQLVVVFVVFGGLMILMLPSANKSAPQSGVVERMSGMTRRYMSKSAEEKEYAPAKSAIDGLAAPQSAMPSGQATGAATLPIDESDRAVAKDDAPPGAKVPETNLGLRTPPMARKEDMKLAPMAEAPRPQDGPALPGMEVAQQQPAQQPMPAAGPNENKLPNQDLDDVVDFSGSRQSSARGLLSLAIDFSPPAGSHEKTFHYVGADTSSAGIPLEIDYVDRHTGTTLRVFVMALVAMICWFLRGCSVSSKIAMATVGLLIPLALMPLVPLGWQVVLDGVFFGTLVAIALWIVRGCLCCSSCRRVDLAVPAKSIVVLLSALLLSSADRLMADDQNPSAKSVSGELKPNTTLIVPFDAGTEPLASERVFLSHEQFLQLYRLANPEKVSKQPAPQAGGIFEAFYAAKVVRNEQHLDESVVQVTARYAVKNFVDGQLVIDLPIGQVSVREARLDGQTAALIASTGCFKIAVPKPGLHVIDVTFDVSTRLSGTSGSFTLPLQPVPAGKLSFELPGKDLSVRINGSTTIYRRTTQGDTQSVELPVDKGEVTIAWQPQQVRGAAAAVVHVDSVEAITLTDAGAQVSHGFAYRIRQGGIADTSFTLPDSLRLQAVNGPDVGGWELQGEGATRKLRVIFRRNITDQTRVTIETFLDAKIGNASVVVPVPQVAPQDVTNEIGQLAVFAGNQFSIRAEQVESLTQIDSDKFATQVPVSRPNVAPQLAYRFSKRPFTLSLRMTRQESQAHVTAQQAAFISLRKLQLTSRLRYNLTGSPRSSLSISLPPNFVLLDAQATGLRDWYIAKHDEGSTLTVELNAPRLGLTEVVIGGFVPRDNNDASIRFPQPLDATRLDSTAAVWLDEGFVGTLDTFEGWRSVDASQVGGELKAVRSATPVQFAFTSTNGSPSAIELRLSQSKPKLSANGLSMVTVTDVGVVYTLALQWQIDSAKTDQLVLTTPDWLAGKLEFQGPGLREATSTDAGNNRTRWTIHLRTPVSGKYFATAIATLPPATTEVLAPALVFENDQKPLDPQRQYVLLINSSLAQLTTAEPGLTESVQREDLPLVVQQEFVDQATELVRVKSLLTAPHWAMHKFAQQAGVPASVNVADLTTVLSRDGTYRGQAIYTIKNRSRQFLALKMPENSELLSVFVAGQPSRAVTTKLTSLNGASVQLVALPKTSAASLSFPVNVVWRGRLSGGLPKQARLTADEFSIPAPQIISQQEDADYGIPVARTRWTVYLPKDLDAQPLRSASRHNLSLSNDDDNPYSSAALQEISELLGYAEQTIDKNRRVQSLNNLKQIGGATDNAKQLWNALQNARNPNDAEFERNKAEIQKRLSDVERRATDENTKAQTFFSRTLSVPGNNFTSDSASEGEIIAQDQQRLLNLGNGIVLTPNAIKSGDKAGESLDDFNFQLKQTEDLAQNGKSNEKPGAKSGKGAYSGNQAREHFRGLNLDKLNSINEAVTTNNTLRQQAGQQGQFGGQQGQLGGQQGQQGQQGAVTRFNSNGGIVDESLRTGGRTRLGRSSGVSNSQTNPMQSVVPLDANSLWGNSFSGNSAEGMVGFGVPGSMINAPGPMVNGPGPGLFNNPQGGPVVNDGRSMGVNGYFDNDAQQSGGLGYNTGSGPSSGDGRVLNPVIRNYQMAPQAGRPFVGGNIGGGGGFAAPQGNVFNNGFVNPNDVFGGNAIVNGAQPNLGQNMDAPEARNGLNLNIAQQQAVQGVPPVGSAPLAWRQAGGLSLGIELPKLGQKLVFTKTGGDPKLALAIRPHESIRWGISLIWSAVWLVITCTILWTLGRPSGLRLLLNYVPVFAVVLGVLAFCVLPSPINAVGFAMFMIGAVGMAIQKCRPTAVA